MRSAERVPSVASTRSSAGRSLAGAPMTSRTTSRIRPDRRGRPAVRTRRRRRSRAQPGRPPRSPAWSCPVPPGPVRVTIRSRSSTSIFDSLRDLVGPAKKARDLHRQSARMSGFRSNMFRNLRLEARLRQRSPPPPLRAEVCVTSTGLDLRSASSRRVSSLGSTSSSRRRIRSSSAYCRVTDDARPPAHTAP